MRKMVVFILSLFIILLPCISNLAQAISISIAVDSNKKSVHPGDTVFFDWTIGNEDDIYTIDFHISSEPETLLIPSDFTLRPGEEQIVNQTVETSESDGNGTTYDIEVIITGEYYVIEPIPGHPNGINPVASGVSVMIINESNESEEPIRNVDDNNSYDYGIVLGISSLILMAIIVIIIHARRKKV
jgi:hypothetical protein